MLLVIPIAVAEIDRAIDLIQWIGELGGCRGHKLVLLVANPVAVEDARAIADLANSSFDSVETIRQKESCELPWPKNANAMFTCACEYVKSKIETSPWLWLECDAIPIRSGWLDSLENAYRQHGKPFMGTVYPVPFRHMNGVAVYPSNIAQINPWMVRASDRAFDLTKPEIAMRFGTDTPLIARAIKDTATNTPHTFSVKSDLDIIPSECVLFHGCKDGSLVEMLRQKYKDESLEQEEQRLSMAQRIKHALGEIKDVFKRTDVYYHSGNLGDIVYALCAIKLRGGGKLIIGPSQNGTSPCSVPVTNTQFNAFLPLLKAQEYLTEVEFSETYPKSGVVDLNTFRNDWNNWHLRQSKNIHTLCRMHCHTLGVIDQFQERRSWMRCHNPIFTDRIIVQRSARYRSEKGFPWQALAKRYAGRMLFVGLETEWKEFQGTVSDRISFWRVRDLLEMAQLVAGAKCCVMNQSFPLALAIALNRPVVVEEWEKSPDCRFDRDTYFGHAGKSEASLLKWIDVRLNE